MLRSMRRAAPVFILLAIASVALWSVELAIGLVALGASALLVRQAAASRTGLPNAQDRERIRRAYAVGHRELGEEPGLSPIDVETPFGRAVAEVEWQNGLPLVRLTQPIGDPVEMAFIIRRRHSAFDLPPVVENTRVPGTTGETRLRRMPLGEQLDSRFEAGSSRPRLFRELMELGMRDAIVDLLDQPHFRLEDLAFSGQQIVLVLQPAGDPSTSSWLQEALDVGGFLANGLHRFLATAAVPSAHS